MPKGSSPCPPTVVWCLIVTGIGMLLELSVGIGKCAFVLLLVFAVVLVSGMAAALSGKDWCSVVLERRLRPADARPMPIVAFLILLILLLSSFPADRFLSRRGKMTKVGHLLGIDDAAGAATLQAEMTVLARQQKEELVRRQKEGGLGSWSLSKSTATAPGKDGGRNVACSSRMASPTPSSAATAALSPANASSSQEKMVAHGSSLSSASAAATRGGGHGDGARSGSMFGRFGRGTARENGSSSSTDGSGGGSGGDTARPHAASHDLAAQDGGALQEATAAAEGMGERATGGVGPSKQPSPDSGGQETGGGGGGGSGGSGEGESRPTNANPRPLSSALDSVSWPVLPPMHWAEDEDSEEAPKNQNDGGDGSRGKGTEDAMYRVETTVAESSPPPPAPLQSRRSWEQDDVGDLVEDENDSVVRTRVDGAADVPVGAQEGGRSSATTTEAEQPPQREATSGAGSGGKEAEGEGGVQAAEERGAPRPTSTPDTKGREGGALRGAENAGQLSLPPLSPAVAVPAAATSTPESTGGSGALVDGSAAAIGGPHVASQSSLPMPWGTCGFGNISESPGGGSVKSTAGVLGVGTSEAPRDIGEGGAVVGDDDWNSIGSGVQEAGVEKPGEVGEEADAPAVVELGDNSDAEFTSSEHENQSPRGSEAPASPSSATRELLDDESGAAPLVTTSGIVAAGEVALEDDAAVVAEEGEAAGAAAVPRDAGEEEDRLTAAFHAHLTPALCEVSNILLRRLRS